MVEPNFTSGPLIPSQEKAVINKEEIIANPALSGVAGHDVHARGEVALEGNFENVLKQLIEFREELVSRFDKAKQEVEEIFTLYPETRRVTFEEESKSAEDLFQDLIQKLELIKGETLVEDRTERANEVVREIGESALEMEAIAEALEEFLYSEANRSADEIQPTAQVIPFPSQNQLEDDMRALGVNMSDADDTSRTPVDPNGAQGSGENEQRNKEGRKGGSGSGTGGDGGDGDEPKSGPSITDRSKAALLQAKAGARVIPEVSSIEESSQRNNGKPRREMLNYTLADRNEVEKWIQTRDYRYKLVKINDALKDFGHVCKEISFLHGWQLLEQSIKDLPEKELADEVKRKKKFSWLDEQFDSFGKDERKQELEAPEKLDELYMQLHDLLVASQKVLLDLQQSQMTGQSVGNEGGTSERRIPFSERLGRIYALANEWKQLMGQFGQGSKRFSEDVAKELGQERVLNVKRFIDELAEQGKQHGWKGEPSKGDKTVAINKLKFLEAQVAAARVVIERDKQSSQEDSNTAPSVIATEPTSSLEEKQREVRRELEKTLEEKLHIFAERMDASLRADDPTLSFAKRRGRILAQLPEFAENVIERFGKEALLSSDEQEAMIEAYTLSIKLSK